MIVMAVRKLRQSWWTDFRFNGTRYRRRSPENTRAGAQAYEALLRGKLAKGEPLDAPREDESASFAEFATEWMETYVTAHNKPSTVQEKRAKLRKHILPFFGEMRLSAVSVADLERYKALKVRSLSKKSINNHLAITAKLLRTAHEWGRIAELPKVRLLRTEPPKTDFLSPNESECLIGAAESDVKWHPFVLCALHTGMRYGELAGLQWNDLDFIRGTIWVRRNVVSGEICTPKSNRFRRIPMTPSLSRALQEVPQATEWVFSKEQNGPLTYENGRPVLPRLCKRAGIRRITWHTLRHTFASTLVGSGVHMRVVQELLGHGTLNMTERYAHLGPATHHDAVAVLERHGQPVVNAGTTHLLSA